MVSARQTVGVGALQCEPKPALLSGASVVVAPLPDAVRSKVIFDDNPRRDALVFSVHLWNPTGTEPNTMTDVFTRHKDIQYSSRIEAQIKRQQQIHRLRHVINELKARLPEEMRHDSAVRELTSYGCQSRMHVIQLLAPHLDRETHMKDVDFSPAGIASRWEAGYADASAVVARAPWRGDFDLLSGVVLYDAANGGASATA